MCRCSMSSVHQLSYMGTWYINGGDNISRLARSAHQSITPVQTVRTKDGWVYVMCMKQKFWEELAQRIGHPELIADPTLCDAGCAAQPPRRADPAPRTMP